ncbi:MAG: hypothetical protein N4A68_17660 [Maledivibacter sp.]|nr:hypothetical protein [Maledivibacter sp.]
MDIVLKQRLYEKLWKDNYYKGADVFREQMTHKEFADLITESKPAMNVVFEKMENAGEEYRFLPEIFFSSCINVGKGLAIYYNLDYNKLKDLNSIDDVAADEAAMTEIAASQLAMEEIAKSSTAMNAVAKSSTAMNAVAGSSTAMNAVAGSSTAMNVVAGSSTAMNIFFGSQYYVGKGIATYAGLSHSIFDSLSSISAVAGSAIAIKAIVMSSTASKIVANSIQNYRSKLISTLDNGTQYFSKHSNYEINFNANTIDRELNTNTIYIPIQCYDDSDTNCYLYYGADTSKRICYIIRHSGWTNINSGVSFRGVRVQGSGTADNNYVKFNKYTVK